MAVAQRGAFPAATRPRRRSFPGRLGRAARATNDVLFVCPGPNPAKGEGCQLYGDESVFRDSIASSMVIAVRTGQPDVTDSFSQPPERDFGAESVPTADIVRSTIFQIAMIDLWRSVGIVPAGVLGCGVGDVIAAYAAGAFSRETAVTFACAIARHAAQAHPPAVCFEVDTDSSRITHLCAEAPARLDYLGTFGTRMVLMQSSAADTAINRAYLESRASIQDCYRLDASLQGPRVHRLRSTLRREFAQATPGYASCAVYASVAGRRLPDKARFDSAYVATVATAPFRFDEALAAAIDDGFALAVINGSGSCVAQAISDTDISVAAVGSAADSESQAWREALEQVSGKRRGDSVGRKLRFARHKASRNPQALVVTDRVVIQERPAWLEDLRRLGPVHRLKSSLAYLVLDYGQVRDILLRPDGFPPIDLFGEITGDNVAGISADAVRRARRDISIPPMCGDSPRRPSVSH